MSTINKDQYAVRFISKLKPLRRIHSPVLIWPMTCFALGLLLWGATFFKVDAEKRLLVKNALEDATFWSMAYAQHLANAIKQIDQITVLAKHQWEESHRALRLEDSFQYKLLAAPAHLYVHLIDRNGETKTQLSRSGHLSNVADRDYFIFHKTNKANVLFVGQPVASRSTGKTVIQFSRRLDTPNGKFDGVVVVVVQPSAFSSFNVGPHLGKAGLLAMIGKDRLLRTSSIGSGAGNSAIPALTAMPAFPSEEGAVLMAGTPWFADHHARFVAWHTLDSYPFIAMVGLSEDELLAPHRQTWDAYKYSAAVGSILLAIFGIVGALLSARLARRKRHAEKVREQHGVVTEGGNDGFYMWRTLRDRSGNVVDFDIEDCNERGAAFYGLNKAQLLGMKLSLFYCDQLLFDRLMATYRRAMELGFYEDEYRVPPESPLSMAWLYRKMVRSPGGLTLTVRDITETKAHEHDLLRLANEDKLTGLPNRHWVVNFLPLALERAKNAGNMLCILFIGLDNFKNVNDTLGHSVGDELLQVASVRLRLALRPGDNVVRLGGDEFIIILEDVVGQAKAIAVASRIVEAFNKPFEFSGGKHVVGASIGISLFPGDGNDTETLLKNADMAMTSAKDAGKGQYRFFDAQLYKDRKQRLDMEQALLRALEQDQFILYYQPRVCTATGQLCGMEALVRWMHPERGLVQPGEFIPLAESTGLILKLGELVLEKACAQLASWKKRDLPLVPVSINVSARQFNRGSVKQMFAACLSHYEISAELVEIEITESTMMGEHTEIIAELSALRALGIKLHVDDFGTGYSSLSQLQRLQMDVLKVDRTFTAELGKAEKSEVFFKAIVSMAHALGMTVVAEGVETIEQVRVLQLLSCDEIQGYFISRPLPAAELPPLMLKRFLFQPLLEDAM